MAGQGKGVLRIAIEDFMKTSGIGKTISGGITTVSELQEKSIVTEYSSILDKLKGDPTIGKWFDPQIYLASDGQHQSGLLSLGGFAIGIGSNAAASLLAPVMKVLNYSMDKTILSQRLDPQIVLDLKRRGNVNGGVFESDLLDLGYGLGRQQALAAYLERQLDPQQIIQLYLRKEIDQAELYKRFLALWYNGYDIDKMVRLSQVIPNVGDLISMAVREAWDDATAARFQYDAEQPTEVIDWAAKQGLSADWVKRYWRAHWQLPSPTMGFEMLHRLRPGTTSNPFTMDDMKRLLKTADYPVFFRDRMIETAYSPLTRVDVRRMYKLKVLTADQVKQAYLDLGYDDTNAKRLADFTVKYEDEAGNNKVEVAAKLTEGLLSQAYIKGIISGDEYKQQLIELSYEQDDIDILFSLTELKRQIDNTPYELADYQTGMKRIVEDAYVNRQISRSEAVQLLGQVGYTARDIDYILAIDDFDYLQGRRASIIKIVGEAYVTRSIDRSAVVTYLGSQNITGSEQASYMTLWDTQREIRSGQLSQTQYKTALDLGVIGLDEYTEYLKGLGYSDASVTILVKTYQASLTAEEEAQAKADAAAKAKAEAAAAKAAEAKAKAEAAAKAKEAAAEAKEAAAKAKAEEAAAKAAEAARVKAAKAEEAAAKAAAEAVRYLTPADAVKGWLAKEITLTDLYGRLEVFGYPHEEARLFIRVRALQQPELALVGSYNKGQLTLDELTNRLIVAGYSGDEVQLYIELYS